MEWKAFCLVAVAMLGCVCDAQYGSTKNAKNPPGQNQQAKQQFEAPLTWAFPDDPQPEPQPDVPFELRHPVPAATVAVQCMEDVAQMEVNKDLFGVGLLINSADLSLGGCGPAAEDAQYVFFRSDLHNCGSLSSMSGDALIYTFTLTYNPNTAGGTAVMRSTGATVTVECHYPRKHSVSSQALDPHWVPFAATKVAEELLYFSLKLMTDDWMYERPIIQYYLGDMIYIEAIVKQYFHVPLRVFVDSCVATAAPDMNSNPSYSFIENHGCLIDAQVTGSTSRFLPREAENKLRFMVEAFRFQGTGSNTVYITCHLKATSASYPIDDEHRACSYIDGWNEASGSHGACTSCGSSPGLSQGSSGSSGGSSYNPGGNQGGSGYGSKKRPYRDVSAKGQIIEWEGLVGVGPISIGEREAQ